MINVDTCVTSESIKISVIIPVYNAQDSIVSTLDSILRAIKSKSEIILVDDCSNDGTIDVIENYLAQQESIKLIRQTVNQGPGISRDTGLAVAQGEYTIFFDSDDFMLPDVVDEAIAKLDKEKINVAVSKYNIVFGKGKENIGMWQGDERLFDEVGEKHGGILSIQELPDFLTLTNYPWNKICRTQFLKDNDINFGKLRLHEDILPHWKILMNAGKIIILNNAICNYMLCPDGNNVTNNKSQLRMQCADAITELYDYIKSDKQYDAYTVSFFVFSVNLIDWAKENIMIDFKSILISRVITIFLQCSYSDLQKVFHTNKYIHSKVCEYLVNKKVF
ncbi:glycosyltransferase family 2 protein [Serratia liquefaciens]|uniref:glycosyltransferase family 2 protein n=1 Tax=Serratia liquefaciens TaxID=614 RepID=UPI00390620C0